MAEQIGLGGRGVIPDHYYGEFRKNLPGRGTDWAGTNKFAYWLRSKGLIDVLELRFLGDHAKHPKNVIEFQGSRFITVMNYLAAERFPEEYVAWRASQRLEI